MPNPNQYKSQDEFLSVCIPQVMKEGLSQDEAKGKCMGMWNNKEMQGEAIPETTPQSSQPAPAKTKIDMLAEFKKLLNKNNMTIDDESLMALAEKIVVQGMSMKARLSLLELQYLEPTEEAQEILILPKGKHFVVTRTFKGWVDFNEKLFKNIIENYNNKELSEPYIDKEHNRAESYGDLSDFRIASEGLFAKIKLNKFGLELVKERAYKYISPTITNHIDTKGNEITDWLATISLVNSPALLGAMPALQEQLQLQLHVIREGKKMDNIMLQSSFRKLTELTTRFGNPLLLQGEVTPEAIMAIFPDIVKMVEDLSKKIAEVTGQKEDAEKKAGEADQAAQTAQAEAMKMKNEKLESEWDVLAKKALKAELWGADEKKMDVRKKNFFENPQRVRDEIGDYLALHGITDDSLDLRQYTSSGSGFEGLDLKLDDDEKQIAKEKGFDISTPEKVKAFKLIIGGK